MRVNTRPRGELRGKGRKGMKGFIEVTNVDGVKRLVSVSKIQHVGEYSGDTVIMFGSKVFKRKLKYDYLWVRETYEEVVAKIKEATE